MSWIAKSAIALFLSSLSVLIAAQSTRESDAANAELQAVGIAMAEIQTWLSEANTAASSEQAKLQESAKELSALALTVDSLKQSIAQKSSELNGLRALKASLESQKASQAQSAGDVIRAVYKRGTANPLKTLLSQSSLNRDARMRHYARLVSTAQLAKIEAFEITLAAIAQNELALASGLSELELQQQQLAAQQRTLELARQKQAAALQQLRGRIQTRADELEQLEFNQAELQQLIEEIRQAMEGVRSFDDVPSFQAAKGKLPMPVAGTIASRFGQQYGGGSLTRQGITLAAEPGTSVRAVHAGHVVFADWLRGSGLLVILDHGNGFMSLYGGNESLSAAPGLWVDVGDVISTSGASANNGQPGLYFEIRERGQPQNPAAWLDLN
jgi:septal ring factor EnvC (AmiA/AmiB activator)